MGNEAFIREEILRYINDKTYNYAVLIDGDWGSGKTYYVTKILKPEIEKNVAANNDEEKQEKGKVIYVSLYGCRLLSEVKDRFLDSIITDLKLIDKYKEKNNAPWKIFRSVTQGGSVLLQTLGENTSVFSAISHWLKLDNSVFIVDDIERCECSINQVLGFLNSLVEQRNAKLILIANENEIGKAKKSDNQELQYLVASSDKVQIKLVDNYTGEESEPDIDQNELERRRRILFDKTEVDDSYQRIKEKLIGVTLRFQPDIHNILHQITESSELDEELKQGVLQESNFFLDIMNQYSHNNLRTYQFFLSKIQFLWQKLHEQPIEAAYEEKVRADLIAVCFLDCVIYKCTVTEDDMTWSFFSSRRASWPSVITYVERGIFLESVFSKDVSSYVYRLKCEVMPNDPLGQLLKEYCLHPQVWNEERIKQVLQRLSAGQYPVETFPEILRLFCRLEVMGFSSQYGIQLAEAMGKAALQEEDVKPIDFDSVIDFIDDPVMENRAKNIADQVNGVILKHIAGKNIKSIKTIVAGSNFGEELKEYTKSAEFRLLSDRSVFTKAETGAWIAAIKNADIENLYYFTFWFKNDYYGVVSAADREKDLAAFKAISDALPDGDTDVVKDYYLRAIKSAFKEMQTYPY